MAGGTISREAVVRAEFGDCSEMDRRVLGNVLKELDPVTFDDKTVELIFQAAGVGGASRVSVDSLLGWVFNGDGGVGQGATTGGATEVLLCRHGETDWNLAHKLQGLTDIRLNATGHKQAQCIADAVKGRGLAAVWTSPLQRAYETATAVATATGLELRVDERLRERNLGVMEGRTGKEIEAEYPAVWAAWKAVTEEMPPESRCEPETDVVARVEAALFDAAIAYPGQVVAMVAHGAILRCLCRRTFGNASISTLSVGPGRAWRPVLLDDDSHMTQKPLKV